MTHRPAVAVAAALTAATLALMPTSASGGADTDRRAVPTIRIVQDGADRATQLVDATRMTLRSAPERGRRASVVVAIPEGLVAGNNVVFHINTDTDPTPEIAYFGAVSSEFQGYRMKSWTRTGTELPFSCGRMRAAMGETWTRLAFNPLCINKGVWSFSVSFNLIAGEDSLPRQDEWLPGVRKFSGRVKAFAG